MTTLCCLGSSHLIKVFVIAFPLQVVPVISRLGPADVELSPGLKGVITSAAQAGRQAGEPCLGSHRLLLALLRGTGSAGASAGGGNASVLRLLSQLGVDPAQLAAATERVAAASGGTEPAAAPVASTAQQLEALSREFDRRKSAKPGAVGSSAAPADPSAPLQPPSNGSGRSGHAWSRPPGWTQADEDTYN